MNLLVPRRWEAFLYGFVLFLSLSMAAAVILFISSHCERVMESTGTAGACGLGVGWILFLLGFLAVAGYAGWQLYRVLQERGNP